MHLHFTLNNTCGKLLDNNTTTNNNNPNMHTNNLTLVVIGEFPN